MDDVVSMQMFCTDLKFYDTFNSVYKTYFHGDFPATGVYRSRQTAAQAEDMKCWELP